MDDEKLSRNFAEKNEQVEMQEAELRSIKPQIVELSRGNEKTEKQAAALGQEILRLHKSIKDRDEKVASLLSQLQEANESVTVLNQELAQIQQSGSNRNNEITKLSRQLQEYLKNISMLEKEISDRDKKIFEINSMLQQQINKANILHRGIHEIQRSIVWQTTMKYHNLIVEPIFPQGTKRREAYDKGIKCGRILINNGLSNFWVNYNNYDALRNNIESFDKTIDEIILQTNSLIEITKSKSIQGNINDNTSKIKKDECIISEVMKFKLLYFLSHPGRKLILPRFEVPDVSIIILTYNKAEYTYQCLESILAHTNKSYELIIIDNGSSDETNSLLDRIENIKLIRNTENLGFIKACNQGIAVSNSKYILFLNNDIIVTPGWLSKLVDTMESVPKTGAVGCKLVWPNGFLQEAGSIIWRDGSALGYGRGDNPMLPQYSHLREVDYCSGACLLVKKDLLDMVGGFDERYLPAYYEDSDLCISIHNMGYKVIYQPDVLIYHHEFTSSSFDRANELMESNKIKFNAKWKEYLKHKFEPKSENVKFACDVSEGKRILCLDDRIPAPYQGSGFPRAYDIQKFLAELGYKVTLFPLDNATPWQPFTNELQQMGTKVFYGSNLSFIQFAESHANCFDLILVSRPHNLSKFYKIIRKYFPNAKLIYDAEAMFSYREILKAKAKGIELRNDEICQQVDNEINLMRKADLVITVSEYERKKILERFNSENVKVLGHSIKLRGLETPFNEREGILFVGGFLAADSPNEDAVIYFVKNILPYVREILSCKFYIVGINPPDSIRNLASDSIVVTGYVEDIKEYYGRCRLFIVPHRYSAGIPYKLEEAMSYGIPSVISDLTAMQLDLKDGEEVFVAKNQEDFARKIIKLYNDETTWVRMREKSLKRIEEKCNPENMKEKLKEILDLAIGKDVNGGEMFSPVQI